MTTQGLIDRMMTTPTTVNTKSLREYEMPDRLFLTGQEIKELSGFSWKSKQIAWLKATAIPFRINATGHPVITRTAIQGRPATVHTTEAAPSRGWSPRAIGA